METFKQRAGNQAKLVATFTGVDIEDEDKMIPKIMKNLLNRRKELGVGIDESEYNEFITTGTYQQPILEEIYTKRIDAEQEMILDKIKSHDHFVDFAPEILGYITTLTDDEVEETRISYKPPLNESAEFCKKDFAKVLKQRLVTKYEQLITDLNLSVPELVERFTNMKTKPGNPDHYSIIDAGIAECRFTCDNYVKDLLAFQQKPPSLVSLKRGLDTINEVEFCENELKVYTNFFL